MQMFSFLAMRKCVCGEDIKRMSSSHTFHESQIRYAHRGLSDICILSSQDRTEFISISDRNRFATAELEHHCPENRHDHLNMLSRY